MNSEHDRKNQVGARQSAAGTFARIEKLPPMLMLLYLAMVGITIIFGVLVAAYVHTRASSELPTGLHPFPRSFSLSTIVLLLSSYTLSQAGRLYRQDELRALARCLGATLLLGCVFAGLQVMGWRELIQQNVLFTGAASGTYVYLISALHIVHLLGGMLFLLVLLLRTLHAERDAIRTLIYIRNPYHRRQLQVLGTYWHFIDVLWVILFATFLLLY